MNKAMCILILIFSLPSFSSENKDIDVNAGMFFQGCDFVGTRADVTIRGVSARRIFKAMEKAEEFPGMYSGQTIRKSDSIACLKYYESYTCLLKVTDEGEVRTPEGFGRNQQQQQQQPQVPQGWSEPQGEPSQRQQQQEQQQQQQCPLQQIIYT